jgi:hypothetical protein
MVRRADRPHTQIWPCRSSSSLSLALNTALTTRETRVFARSTSVASKSPTIPRIPLSSLVSKQRLRTPTLSTWAAAVRRCTTILCDDSG